MIGECVRGSDESQSQCSRDELVAQAAKNKREVGRVCAYEPTDQRLAAGRKLQQS